MILAVEYRNSIKLYDLERHAELARRGLLPISYLDECIELCRQATIYEKDTSKIERINSRIKELEEIRGYNVYN